MAKTQEIGSTSLQTPIKRVSKLQRSLHAKAKPDARFRFYSLWDKILRKDVLAEQTDGAAQIAVRPASMARATVRLKIKDESDGLYTCRKS